MDREMAAQIADGSFKLVERPAKQRRYAAFRLALQVYLPQRGSDNWRKDAPSHPVQLPGLRDWRKQLCSSGEFHFTACRSSLGSPERLRYRAHRPVF